MDTVNPEKTAKTDARTHRKKGIPLTQVLLGSADAGTILHWRTSLESNYNIDCIHRLERLFDQCGTEDFALIVLDHALLAEDFAEYLARLQHVAPQSKILLIGRKCSREVQLTAFGQGIPGYLEADASTELLVKAVDRLLKGESWVERGMVTSLLKAMREQGIAPGETSRPENLSSLTPREIEIAERICAGENNKIIARHLDITDRTVKAHLGSIFRKLQVADRLQLALRLKDCFLE